MKISFYSHLYKMDQTINAEQAKEFTKIFAFWGFMESRTFLELLRHWEERALVDEDISSRTQHLDIDEMSFYVNNISAIHGSPKRVGTYACDVCFAYAMRHNISMKECSKYVWWLLNELWYYDYIDDDENIYYLEDGTHINIFCHRLNTWFGGVVNVWGYNRTN